MSDTDETASEVVEVTPGDLRELRAKLTKLLVAQHSDVRSLRDIKQVMAQRQREINALSDTIEDLQDQVLDVRAGE